MEIHQPPFQAIGGAADLVLAIPMSPGERTSDEDPPEWDRRDEGWTIDGLLGCYDSATAMITIFSKGIEVAAPQIGASPEALTIVVRLHEWAHAMFHLGVDQQTSANLAKASLDDKTSQIDDTRRAMTQAYQAANAYVHEQLAQVLTKVALDDMLRASTTGQAKDTFTKAIDAFERLMDRQAEQYRLDQFGDLTIEQLRRRLRGFIRLTRSFGVQPSRQVWDTIMPW